MIHVSMDTGALTRPPGTLRRAGAPPVTHIMDAEQFRWRVDEEAARHARYLGGLGILRIAPRRGRMGAQALREAVETETRRTDAICTYPDGSHALLLVNADGKTLETVARRLESVAREIAAEHEQPVPDFATGAAAADGRRVTADELWLAANDAMEVALETAADIAFGRCD